MVQKLQTKVTDLNRAEFYKQLYDHQTKDMASLIDLSQLEHGEKILIDCCGWYYKKCFPQQSIIALENIKTALEFDLTKNQFDKLFDGRSDDIPRWPKIVADSPTVIFDRSPILNYQNLETLKKILDSIDNIYRPKAIILRQSLLFIDDPRLVDRFYNISKLCVDRHVIKKFNYDLDSGILEIHFRNKSN